MTLCVGNKACSVTSYMDTYLITYLITYFTYLLTYPMKQSPS